MCDVVELTDKTKGVKTSILGSRQESRKESLLHPLQCPLPQIPLKPPGGTGVLLGIERPSTTVELVQSLVLKNSGCDPILSALTFFYFNADKKKCTMQIHHERR